MTDSEPTVRVKLSWWQRVNPLSLSRRLADLEASVVEVRTSVATLKSEIEKTRQERADESGT